MIFTTIHQEPKKEETPQFFLKLFLLSLIILFALSANFAIFYDNHTPPTNKVEKFQEPGSGTLGLSKDQ